MAAILPYTDDEENWRTRADDILIWGSELAGAEKYVFSRPPVKYRVHGGNRFYGRAQAKREYRRRRKAADRFCAWVVRKNSLTLSHLLEVENLHGDTPWTGRLSGWMRAGRTGMSSLADWIRCGFLLLKSAFVGRPLRS